jgi:hypothetical protein
MRNRDGDKENGGGLKINVSVSAGEGVSEWK